VVKLRIKKRWKRYSGAAAIVIAVGAGVLTYVGSGAHNPAPPSNTIAVRIHVQGSDSVIDPVSTWTQTGGERCFATTADGATATCYAAGPAKTYHATCSGLGWVPEKARINHLQWNEAIDCAGNWTCSGTATTTPGKTSPEDSNPTATEIYSPNATSRVQSVVATGYTASATLYLRLWVRCSSSVLRIQANSGASDGRWTVDCTAIGGAWTLIHETHAAVTELNQFVASGSGNRGIYLMAHSAAITAQVWQPTLTEVDGLSTIPTAAAAVDTGSVTWSWANDSGQAWQAGDTVTSTIAGEVGACWYTGATDPVYLSGQPGSECTGIICEHKVESP
jgi:hypothetical protein